MIYRLFLNEVNNPPNPPTIPVPANGAGNRPVSQILSWTGGDPDGNKVTYDVYFGTVNPPTAKVSAGQSSTSYNPGNLNYAKTYYWKVVAKDPHGATSTGPLWSFTTVGTTPTDPSPGLEASFPQIAVVNQPITMQFDLGNVGGIAEHGGISISFPELNAVSSGSMPPYTSSKGNVSANSPDGLTVRLYDQGDPISRYPPGSGTVATQHLLVEGTYGGWANQVTKFLVITFAPKVVGLYHVRARGWLTTNGYLNYFGYPSSGISDQQGYPTFEWTIQVSNQPPPSGTINVQSSPSGALFSIIGPAGYSAAGSTPWSTSGRAAGDYTVTWGDLSGYTKPSPSTQPLVAGSSITFNGTYTSNQGDHTLTGFVIDTVWGTKIPDATVTILTTNQSAFTNPNGAYTFYGLAHGSYVVKASKSGYYDSDQYGVDITAQTPVIQTQDFGLNPIYPYRFYGTITRADNGKGLEGATVAFSNGGGTATTDPNGDYSRPVAAGWCGTITPSYSGGGTFDPPNLNIPFPLDSNVGGCSFRWTPPTLTPVLSVSPSSLSFNCQQGGSPSPQNIIISNSGSGTLSWSSSISYESGSGSGWLSIIPASQASNNTTAQVSVSSASLGQGSYHAHITVTGAGGTQNSPQTIGVDLTVSPPTPTPVLSVSPLSLSFNCQQGGSPAAQSVTISNSGSGTLSWSAGIAYVTGGGWLSINPTLQTSNYTTAQVSVSSAGLGQGSYHAHITITGGSGTLNSPQTVEVTLTVSPPTPTPVLSVSPLSLSFSWQRGDATPPSQKLIISNAGSSTLSWTTQINYDHGFGWLSLNPASDTNNYREVTVSLNPAELAQLAQGTYRSHITVSGAIGTLNSPIAVAVELVVTLPHAVEITVGPVATPNSIDSGGSTQLSVTAQDSWGHALTYRWFIDSSPIGPGTFTDQNSAQAQWAGTNPTTSDQTVRIGVEVQCADNSTITTQGFAEVVVRRISPIEVQSGPTANPNPVPSGGTALLTIYATDNELPYPLVFRWDVVSSELGEPGTFTNPNDWNTNWTAPQNTSSENKRVFMKVRMERASDTSVFAERSLTVVVRPALQYQYEGTLDSNDLRSALKPNSYTDIYAFKVAASGSIRIDMFSTFDNYLYLYQGSIPSAGNKIGENDNYYGTNASLNVFVQPGVYSIEATSYGSNATGPYRLGSSEELQPHVRITSPPTATPSIVIPGGSVELRVEAADISDHPRNYSWSVIESSIGEGTFTNRYSNVTGWIAPPNPGSDTRVRFRVRVECWVRPDLFSEEQEVDIVVRGARPAVLTVSPSSLNFGTSSATLLLLLRNDGGASLSWSASKSQSWLGLSQYSSSLTVDQQESIVAIVARAGQPPGLYQDTIAFSSNGGNRSVSVTMEISSSAKTLTSVGVSPTSWAFTAAGQSKQLQATAYFSDGTTEDVTNQSGWSSSDSSVAQVNSSSGLVTAQNQNGSATISASYSYNGVTKSGSCQVTVSTVPTPALSVSPLSLSFNCQQGGSPAAQSITIANSGGGTLSWSAGITGSSGWLSINPTSQTSNNTTAQVSVSSASLSQGSYHAHITITGGSGTQNSPKTVEVTLTVSTVPTPALSVSPLSLSFNCQQGGSPAAQSITIANSGGGTLSWSAGITGSGWLSINPASQTSNNTTAQVSVSSASLSQGSYHAHITITSATGTQNSPKTVEVNLTVSPPQTGVTFQFVAGNNLISIPLITSSNPITVFSGLPSGWQLYYWDPITGQYRDKTTAKIQPGLGFWLKAPSAVSYVVSGQPNLSPTTEVLLSLGDNMIGVPYNKPLPWDSVQVRRGGQSVTLVQAAANGWVSSTAVYWEGGTYKSITSGGSFQPLKGYWLKAKTDGCSLIFTP